MADMMRPPMGGMPQGGMSPPQGDPIKDNMSMLNKTDLGLMAGEGKFTPDMTVRDALRELGIDVDGPVTQLTEFAQKQTQNANPINKMKNIAGMGQPQGEALPPKPPAPQGPPPGLEGLMQGA